MGSGEEAFPESCLFCERAAGVHRFDEKSVFAEAFEFRRGDREVVHRDLAEPELSNRLDCCRREVLSIAPANAMKTGIETTGRRSS